MMTQKRGKEVPTGEAELATAPLAEHPADFVTGSGNVFADLGLPDADELMFKADLAGRLHEALRASSLKQVQMAALLGWTQPEVSAFTKGRISGFSSERILRAFKKLGKGVEIRIKDDADEWIIAV